MIAAITVMGFMAPTATPSPSVVTGARSGAGSVTSASTTVTVSGGLAPYTILWTNTGGDAAIEAVDGTSFTTAFLADIAAGETLLATLSGVVTDANSQTATATVSVALYEIS